MIIRYYPVYSCGVVVFIIPRVQAGNISDVDNPFKNLVHIEAGSIGNVKLEDTNAGFIHAPRDIPFSFDVYDNHGKKLPFITSDYFACQITNKFSSFRVNAQISYSAGRYAGILYLPPVLQSGWYDFILTFSGAGQKKKNIFIRKALYYEMIKINILFLVDNSGSMFQNDPGVERYRAIKQILFNENMLHVINKIGIISFSDLAEVQLHPVDARNRKAIEAALGKRFHLNTTNIPDAFKKAAGIIKLFGIGKTIIIFLTDGVSSLPVRDEHRAAELIGSPVFPVGLMSGNRAEYDKKFLQRVASDSGGSVFTCNDLDIQNIYESIIRQSVRQNEKVYIYPVQSAYCINESPVIRAAGVKSHSEISIRADRLPAEIVDKSASGNIHTVFLLPLPPGRHVLHVAAGGAHLRQQITVTEFPQPYYILDGSLEFGRHENEMKTSVLYKIVSRSKQDYTVQIFMPSLRSGKNTIPSARFTFQENPFYLKAGAVYPREMSLHLGEHPHGVYSGYTMFSISGRVFLHTTSVTIQNRKTYRDAFYFPTKKRVNKRAAVIPGIVFFCAAVFIIYHFKNKKRFKD